MLPADCWMTHVLPRRPYFAGNEECVRETLTDPHFVKIDADLVERECFYRPSPLPYPYGGVYAKVVVAFRRDPLLGVDIGEVVMVYLTDRSKSGEKHKWP